MYSDDLIKGHIDWMVVELDDPNIALDDQNDSFTTELSSKNKALITLKIVMNIINPQNSEFSYSSPILSVRRKTNLIGFKLDLENKIDDITRGKFAVATDSDLDAVVNGYRRAYNAIQSAFAKAE